MGARRFLKDESGLAAIEMAFVLPAMLVLLLGGMQVTNALQADRRATEIAASVTDLTAQVAQLTNAGRNDIFAAADALMAPYSTSNLGVVLSSVTFVGGKSVIAWSEGHGVGQARLAGDDVSALIVPSTIIGPGSSLIMTEVKYTYQDPLRGIFGVNSAASVNFAARFFGRPRMSVAVSRVP